MHDTVLCWLETIHQNRSTHCSVISSRKGLKDGHVIGIAFGLSESIMYLCFAASFYYGGVLVHDGEMTLEEVMK